MKAIIITALSMLVSFGAIYEYQSLKPDERPLSERCVYRNLMGEEKIDSDPINIDHLKINKSIDRGLLWLEQAQQGNGAWGAGLHSRQQITDPHAVKTDPATTAMVGMALLSTGNTLQKGEYQEQVAETTNYILDFIKNPNAILKQTQGTQIQMKLGSNIDIILSCQYLNNLLETMSPNDKLYKDVQNALNNSAGQIQELQDHQGKIEGAGWAGVLQTSLASTALELAESNGAEVDTEKLQKFRTYQQSNYDESSGSIDARDGAGVLLYAVSGSTRASSKEAKKARDLINNAKQSGAIPNNEISYKNLVKAGVAKDDALRLETSYKVYESAKISAQNDAVTSGFGNNGGEEFLSYLQTGESLIINEDETWKNWYDNMSAKMLSIQENNGSWRGHHCITSPVFCTATCILILSIQNDIKNIKTQGLNK
jgi:hypothetical protein